MVNIYFAYTAAINPEGVTPALTRAQCWTGLQMKIRDAPLFVGAIASCDVLEETDDGTVTREVVFKSNSSTRVKEVCKSYEPMKVDFHQPNGSLVSNIISLGAGGDMDLHMTYTFQWLHPEVEAGSPKVAELQKTYTGMAKMAVEKSIESIRRLVGEGKIV